MTKKPAAFAVTCGSVRLTWRRAGKGKELWFAGLSAGRRGFQFGEGSRLWRIELRDRAGYVTWATDALKCSVSRAGRGAVALRWAGAGEGLLDVTLRIKCDAGRPILRCRLDVKNLSRRHTIWGIEFPSLRDLAGPTGSHRDDVLVTPEGFGCAIPDPVRQPRLSPWGNRGYPGAIQTMPFVALVNGGLGFYLGAHDPGASLHRFRFVPEPGATTLPMTLRIEAENSGRAQPRVTLGYDVVLGLFEGDWYDAAQIYRPWATRQRWGRTPARKRPDIPAWAFTLPLWVNGGLANKAAVPAAELARRAATAVAFRKAYGRDIGLHLYQWHDHPFDVVYPDYRPRPGMKAFVGKLQGSGIRVMPYINGRLFDMDNPDWLGEQAFRYSTKDAAPKLGSRPGRFFSEVYGSMTHMAVMCPATRYWQEKVADVVERIVRALGVDGVYIDQIGAAWSEVCADPSHGHVLRNGAWWVRGYERMIEEIWRRFKKMGRQVFLTTESNADAYNHLFGGLLMVNSQRNHLVPLFPAVYGGAALLWGRPANVRDPAFFRIVSALNMLWGCQTGWFGFDAMELLVTPAYRAELQFLRDLGQLYDRMEPYIHGGGMGRPPVLEGRIRRLKRNWNFCGLWPETLSTVHAARWNLGARRSVALVNTHDGAQAVEFALEREELAAGNPRAWSSGAEPAAFAVRGRRAQLRIPPRAMVLVEFGAGRRSGPAR